MLEWLSANWQLLVVPSCVVIYAILSIIAYVNRHDAPLFWYIQKRIGQSTITILLIVCVVFLLLRLMPTDYFFTEDELIKLTDEQKLAKLEAAGLLDDPFTQLGRFLLGLFQGDLGVSRRIQANQPITKLLSEKFGVSMRLGLIALAISLVLGVIFGVLQARYKDGLFDSIGTGYTIITHAVPALVLYSLILVMCYAWFGLPAQYTSRATSATYMLFHLQFGDFVLFNGIPIATDKSTLSSIPAIICLSLGSTASYMLWIRRYMVDELNKDYIRLARLKGASTRRVMFRHVLKNALVPMVQQLPVSILLTIGGSLLVEKFFAVPGMGPLLTDAIGKYDTNVVQIIVMLYAALGIIGLLIGDILMTLIDPRIRLTSKGGTR